METGKRQRANGSRASCVTRPVCLSPAAAVAHGSVTAAAKLTLSSASISCHSVDAAGRPVRPTRALPSQLSSSTAFADFDDGGGSLYVHAETAAASAAAAAVRAVAVVSGAATAGDTPTAVAGATTAAAGEVPMGDDDDGRPFPTAAIFFTAHPVLHSPWNRGVMRASPAAVAASGGPRVVRVANAHPAPSRGVECFRRAVLLGVDGTNTDAHVWGSDAPVVSAAVAAADAHVPAIPREAQVLREAVYACVGVHPQVHSADTLRLHPPAAGVVSAAVAAGFSLVTTTQDDLPSLK
ncbi:hypothetical protein MMPV_002600 [Pyropia vietnamensis]